MDAINYEHEVHEISTIKPQCERFKELIKEAHDSKVFETSNLEIIGEDALEDSISIPSESNIKMVTEPESHKEDSNLYETKSYSSDQDISSDMSDEDWTEIHLTDGERERKIAEEHPDKNISSWNMFQRVKNIRIRLENLIYGKKNNNDNGQ